LEDAAVSAETAEAPRRAAAGATAAAATTATPATAAATATTAATATATPSHLLEASAAIFLVEEMEGGEADVGDFFLAEQQMLRRSFDLAVRLGDKFWR
jgi:hypothetical protein